MNSFGIVIAFCRNDSHSAQAFFWSIRHFLSPDIPIYFIVDGDSSILGQVLKDPFRHNYFCTGTFFPRTKVFSLENLQEKIRQASACRGLFQFGEMGFLNLMIFHAGQKGELTVTGVDYQTIPVDKDDRLLWEQYSPRAIAENRETRAVVHCCGKKVHIFTASPKVALMNHFRLRCLLEAKNMPVSSAVAAMIRQDIRYVFFPLLKRGLRKAGRFFKRLCHK